jgi:hypothetical protein
MTATPLTSELRQTMLNLTRFHREHEKFYASAPREQAVMLQRHARTLQALADRWSGDASPAPPASSPYAGAADLNDPAALQLDGVLFMEGEGRPTEITHLIRDLRALAADFTAGGEWLSTAMQASWDLAASFVPMEELADVLGERHRIIANDWQAAAMQSLVARILDRAADMLDQVDFTPAALRADIAGRRVSAGRLFAAAELISHGADLCSDSAGLVHDNERRWRVFRERVQSTDPSGAEG